jgi:hypothetical protein
MSTVNVNRVVDASGGVLAPISSVMRNRIINGAMVIDQRNAGAAVTINAAQNIYTIDRWLGNGENTDGVFTIDQVTDAPVGFTNSAKITVTTADASIGSAQFYIFRQLVEGFNIADLGWGTANAKTITVSFWVRSSLTGTFSGAINNATNDRNYPFTYSISAANTWEFKTVTIAGDTSGTWLTNNNRGLGLTFSLGCGSGASATAGSWTSTSSVFGATGAINLISTVNATWDITGIQLEKGTQATSFEYRQYQQELALCQRYCVRYSNGASGTYCYYPIASANDTTTTAQGTIQFPVSMRSASAMTLTTTGTAANYSLYSTGALRTCTVVPTLAVVLNDATAAQITLTVASSLTSGHSSNVLGTNSASPFLLFSSEL